MNPIEKLTDLFEHFPGIGPRQARRFVQYLLSHTAAYRGNLSLAIQELGSSTRQCTHCFRWFVKETPTKQNECTLCTDTRRDVTTLFVIEKDADIENVERSGFRGVYFVLGGTIALASEEPEKHVRLRQLLSRIEGDASQKGLKEVILGLSATSEGDHTRMYLEEKLRPLSEGLHFKVSSLGRGLSTGSELEYADPDTIKSALSSRQ